VLFILDLLRQGGSIEFQHLDFFIDGALHTGIDLGFFALHRERTTISFFRVEMSLASSSRIDFSFFHIDSDNMLWKYYK
jgi:hypothetical protein